jgi:hypothetical protein
MKLTVWEVKNIDGKDLYFIYKNDTRKDDELIRSIKNIHPNAEFGSRAEYENFHDIATFLSINFGGIMPNDIGEKSISILQSEKEVYEMVGDDTNPFNPMIEDFDNQCKDYLNEVEKRIPDTGTYLTIKVTSALTSHSDSRNTAIVPPKPPKNYRDIIIGHSLPGFTYDLKIRFIQKNNVDIYLPYEKIKIAESSHILLTHLKQTIKEIEHNSKPFVDYAVKDKANELIQLFITECRMNGINEMDPFLEDTFILFVRRKIINAEDYKEMLIHRALLQISISDIKKAFSSYPVEDKTVEYKNQLFYTLE